MTRIRAHSLGFVALIASVALVACGGGADVDDGHDMDTMETPAETPAAEPPADTIMLGGGRATELGVGDGGSPHVKVDWQVGGGNISITYGRPYLKDRVVGETVEPMDDRFWRLGADEATTLVTDRDLMLGGTHIPAGEYTLWTQRMGDEFHLIVNTETGQWGTAYNAEHDFAHIPMEVGELDPPADQLTLTLDADSFGFEWGQMTATVPVMVH